MQRYLSQTLREDAGPYARLIRIVEHPLEDEYRSFIVSHCTLTHEIITQLEKPFIEANASLTCPQSIVDCSFVSSSKLSWAFHVHFGHPKLKYCTDDTQGGFVLPSNDPHHVNQSETVFTKQKQQYPISLRCSAPGCSMEFFGGDAFRQWLGHIDTHLEQLATPDDSQATYKVTECNAESKPNLSNAIIVREVEINRRLGFCEPLCELLQRSTLDDNRKHIDQLRIHRFSSSISLALSSKDVPADHIYPIDSGIFINYTHENSGYFGQIYPRGQVLPRHSVEYVSRSVDVHSCMKLRQMERQKETSPTISSYFSDPSSPPMDEIFSRKSSYNTNTNSTSLFPDEDDNDIVFHSLGAEQIPCSDLVNEFAHFTISWFMAWTANRRNNTGFISHNQETQSYGGEINSQCSCGNGRKRSRGNDDNGRQKKQQKCDESNGDEPGDGSGNDSHIAKNPSNLSSEVMFACPFFQRDPSSCGQRRWGICGLGKWASFHRVREHIYRKHELPQYYCERCFEDLKDASAFQQHSSQLQCEPRMNLPYATRDKIFQLKVPMKRGIPESEKWKAGYHILFPEDTNVPSPYKEEPSYSANDQTNEQRNLTSDVERIRNSSSSDVHPIQRIEQIQEVTIYSIRAMSPGEQYVPQGANNEISTDAIAARHDGMIYMPFFLSPVAEYTEMTAEFMGYQLSAIPTEFLCENDGYVWDAPLDMDLSHVGDAFNASDMSYAGGVFNVRDALNDGDISHGEDSGDLLQYENS